MKVLLIIPAYNEAGNLTKLVKSIKTLETKYDLDYIVINDCSTDETKQLCAREKINLINLPVNLGIGGAVQTGYKFAYENNYDIAIQVDGDGQHDINYIKYLIDGVKNGANMCIGSRFIEKKGFQSTFLRRFGIVYFSKLIKLLTSVTIMDVTSGFRACDRNIIKIFAQSYPRDYPEPETIVTVLKKGYKIQELPVVMRERQTGKSSITNIKSVYYMIKVTLAIMISNTKHKKAGSIAEA